MVTYDFRQDKNLDRKIEKGIQYEQSMDYVTRASEEKNR
jgi:hypothetical protein